MAMTSLEHVLDAADHQDTAVERRALLVQFYLDRLAHLLAGNLAPSAELTSAEQRQLRSRAMIAIIRALTALGAGPAASACLRSPGRRHAPPQPEAPLGRSSLVPWLSRMHGKW